MESVLAVTGKESIRRQDLPAHVMVYYVIVLALYTQSSYREVVRCLLLRVQWLVNLWVRIGANGTFGISRARTRLGFEAIKKLHDEVMRAAHRNAISGRA